MNYIDLKDKSEADLIALLKEKKLELFTLERKVENYAVDKHL